MTATHDTNNDTIMKADRRGRLRFSPEQRTSLLKAYQASGLSGPRFAALHGMKYPTLANWVQKSKRTRETQAASPGPRMLSFIAAEVVPVAESGHSDPLEVILPGGGRINIAGSAQVALAAALLRELQSSPPC